MTPEDSTMTTLAGADLLFAAMDELFPVDKPAPFEAPPVVPLEGRDEAYMGKARSWCAKSLQGYCETLAAMEPDTGRNHYLNKAGWRLSRFALAGHLDADAVTVALRDAALECGLGVGEIEATLASAHRAAYRDGPQEPPVTGAERAPDPFDLLGVVVDEHGVVQVPDAEALSAIIRKNLPIIDWHELWANEDVEEWIVEPLLPARRLVALYSAPKVGKSLLLLELCCAIATGRDVLSVSIDRPRRVLYVDFENDPKADVRERLQAMGYGPDDLGNLAYLSFPTLAALDSERGGQELMAAVEVYECEVVVVDTVSRAIAGEENENDTWLNFYRHTGLRMKQKGIALIRLDHSGKDESKGQRGGSAKSGDVDAVWRLSRITDDSYRLDCEAARMPIAEKTLVLHREVVPHLRHRVDAEGRSAAWRIKVDQIVKVMDGLGLAPDVGADIARPAVRAAGIKARNEVIAAAIKQRQMLSGKGWEPD